MIQFNDLLLKCTVNESVGYWLYLKILLMLTDVWGY